MPFGSSLYVGPDSDVTVRAIEPCFEDAGMDRKNPSSYCHPSTTWELIRGKIRVFMRGWGGLGAINVRAGTTVCGIRGTEFILAHDPARQQIDLSLLEGKVELSTPAQSQMVAPGQSVTVTGEKIGAPSPLDRSVWDRQVAEVAQGLGEPASGSDAQIAQGPPAEGTTTKEGKEAAKPSSEPQPDASASPATPAGTAAKPSPEPTPPSSAQDATPLPSEDLRGLTPEQAVKRLAFEALQARNRSEATLLRTMDVTEGRPTTVWPAEVREQVLKLVKDAIDDLHTALEKLKAITRDYPETADAKTLLSGGEVAGLSIAMIEKNIQSTQSELLEPMASNEATIFPRADGDIAYLKLTTFDEQTHASLIKEIEAAKRSSIGAYIIDLRDNAGGAFDPAVAVADAFLDKGTIVQTKASDSDKLERIDATPGDITEGKKLVVLINGRTAAGAEVVAAALQDHKRATIIGTRSLGGGSSERARYVAPSNRAIEIGIDPDINVEQDPRIQPRTNSSTRLALSLEAVRPNRQPRLRRHRLPRSPRRVRPRTSRGSTPQQAANRLAVEARQAWNRTDVLYEQREKKFTSGSPATWSPEIREEVRALSQEIIREGRAALEKLNAIIRDYPETDHAVTLIGGGEVAGLSIARVETDLGEFERGWLQTEDELRRLEQEGAKEQPAPPSAPKESNLPASISQTTAALRERTYQAVVQITSTKAVAAQPPSASSGTAQPGNIPGPIPGLPEDHPLNEFFKHLPKKPQGESPPADTAKPQQTTASGFLVDASGLVVTTNHVVDQAQKLTAELHDGTKYEVEMVGADPRLDIALLQIKNAPGSFAVLSFGDSEKVKPGDWVAAMGSPFGLKGSITSGLVSATDRALEGRPYGLIQTDAQITNGYSGGPLLNSNGEVIGVIAALLAPSGSPATVNFAVPSNLAAQAIAQLKQYGEVRRGWLGVTIQAVSDEIAQSLGVKDRRGALVSEFFTRQPRRVIGAQAGDLIREVDGKPTKDARHLARQIAELQAGRSVRLKVLRNGGEREIEVTLGQFPDRSPSERPDTAASEVGLGSLLLAPLNEALRAKYSIKGSVGGVVITGVADGSEAASKGLKPGLIVRRATGAMVRSLADLTAQLDEVKRLGRPSILVLVEEGNGQELVRRDSLGGSRGSLPRQARRFDDATCRQNVAGGPELSWRPARARQFRRRCAEGAWPQRAAPRTDIADRGHNSARDQHGRGAEAL
ncbi:MAG: S41 family peptidase [Hyphomicrobium sp.]|nr:S41 family peptidase [Hyphomicrobium sp.]